jgi:hypothetical protein
LQYQVHRGGGGYALRAEAGLLCQLGEARGTDLVTGGEPAGLGQRTGVQIIVDAE